MNHAPPDICVILTAHREGLLLRATLESAVEAMQAAAARGISASLLAIADRADALTRAMLDGCEMLEADSGDVGLNRNAAVAATRARYIAMLDADDIWGPSWLAAAFAVAAAGPPGAVWHPEANLYFGHHGHEHWFMHPDMEAPGFDRTAMELFNPWTALCFARREVFVETPYPASDVAGGFGFEDWHWNLATAARGAIHKIVPGTLHLIRQKPTSLMRRTSAEGALRGPPPE